MDSEQHPRSFTVVVQGVDMKNKDLIGLIIGALVSKLIDRIFGEKQDGHEHRNIDKETQE